MNLINTILILIIIIFLINYLSNGQILDTLKRIFDNCKENIESFTGRQYHCSPSNIIDLPFTNQLDFPYIYNNSNDISNLDQETYGLYQFINDIVSTNVNNYDLTPSYGERTKVSKEIETDIINILSNIFNYKDYTFNNIQLNQDIYYYENYRGKEFEPFIFTTDAMHYKKNLGNITLLIDCFLRYDKKNNLLTITSLKLIKRNSNDKIITTAIQKNKDLTTKMKNTFNDIYIPNNNNDLFIKQPNKKNVSFENNDTDNSLIPSIDEILI
jgi:hypothetical protein